MTTDDVTMIDGWRCVESFAGTDWVMRTATRGRVEYEATVDGLRVEESSSGYLGYCGTYSLPANVFMWLAQAVRL